MTNINRRQKSFGSGEKTLRALAERARRSLRAHAAHVAGSVSVAGDTGGAPAPRRVRWLVSVGPKRGAAEPPDSIADRLLERLAETDESFLIEDTAAAEDDGARATLLSKTSHAVRRFAVAPLRARGELIGALAIELSAETPALGDDERAHLADFAELAALALDNLLLFEVVSGAKKVWEQTFDAIPDGVVVYDEESRVARCNLRAAELLGLGSPMEAIGLSQNQCFAKLFGERAAAAYHVAERAGVTSSFELQSAGGARYFVSTAPLEVSTGNGRGWSVLTWKDITELSAVQDQLARSRRLAMAGRLAAGVAHEINNPLAAITTCAETMLLDLRESAELAERVAGRDWNFYLEEIVRQALRGKGITRGLLDLSRQQPAEQRSCDVNTIVAQCLKLYEQRAPHGVVVEKAFDERLAPVASDESMLRQILDNLLSNALDAVGERGTITVTTHLRDGRIVCEVADTGPGIPFDHLLRIFEPFYTTKEVGRGSGLGLSISAALAEALGGALTVESKEGSGSRFRLWVPDRIS